MSTSYDDVMVSLGLEPSTPPKPKAECGTYAAYMQHKLRREDACEPCKEAKRRYYRGWYARNRDRIRAARRVGGGRP